jgi:elongation factor 1 alpha-like protein
MWPKSSSAKEFFQDMPWLNIPEQRRAVIVIEPLYPRGGLLGGASNQAAPKMSKLAALAAARKRKETEKAVGEDSKSVNNSVALLDKLRIKEVNAQDEQLETKTTDHPDSRKKCKVEGIETATQTQSLPKANRKYPKKTQKPPTPPPPPEPEDDKMSDDEPPEEPPPLAAPSAFASALFGPPTGASNPVANATPFLAARFGPNYGSDVQSANFNPFAGPSPDDIVASAQASSKGLKKQSRKS